MRAPHLSKRGMFVGEDCAANEELRGRSRSSVGLVLSLVASDLRLGAIALTELGALIRRVVDEML